MGMHVNPRAQHTAQQIRALRMFGLAKRPRKVLPRQVPPIPIEREYARAILRVLEAMRPALAEFMAALPGLLESAARERQVLDSVQHVDAGESKTIQALIASAARKMGEAITPELITRLADKFARRTATYQRIQLGRQVKAALGADVFIQDRGLETLIGDFAAENASLITSIPRQLADRIAQASTRAVTLATPHTELAKEIARDFGLAKNRAKLIARDQVGKLYGQVNAQRQRELGADKFIWRTVHDERVRPEHVAADGNTYSYAEGGHPTEGLPGEPIMCRCYAEPLFNF